MLSLIYIDDHLNVLKYTLIYSVLYDHITESFLSDFN